MKLKNIFFIIICCFIFYLLPTFSVCAEEGFNPNYIISDSDVFDWKSMDLQQIKNLLNNKNSYLLNYSCPDPDGKIMTAPIILYDRAITNKVSPKLLIVLLQKEQSLIEGSSPKQSSLDWATGYGCPDGNSCNPRWKGFWKQVNSASLQFRDYMDNPHLYTYKAGQTYTFTNPYSSTKKETTIVTPVNQATAALYNYTPHVYNGNYNFYKIWQRYFTKTYSDGSLLQVAGEGGVWLLQNGKKHPFLTKSALTSRFDESKIILVSKSDLDAYEKGAPIKFPNYSIIRSPKGNMYLLVDDKRRGFADNEAFRKIGFNPEEVMNASWEDINQYQESSPITATSTYPTGALLQDKVTGGVYWVYERTKSPILDRVFLTTKFKHKKIIQVSEEELKNYTKTSPVLFDNGELLKSQNSPAVYLVSNNQKHSFASGIVFESLGYKWENVIIVSPQLLSLYEHGDAVN